VKRGGVAAFGALAMAALCAGWAVLAWNTGFGGDIFIKPGHLIAEWVLPMGAPSERFEARSAKSAEEAFAQFVVARSFQQGLQAWWCAVVFWLVVVPALAFVSIFTTRRRGA
jgi:hypothetical protein